MQPKRGNAVRQRKAHDYRPVKPEKQTGPMTGKLFRLTVAGA